MVRHHAMAGDGTGAPVERHHAEVTADVGRSQPALPTLRRHGRGAPVLGECHVLGHPQLLGAFVGPGHDLHLVGHGHVGDRGQGHDHLVVVPHRGQPEPVVQPMGPDEGFLSGRPHVPGQARGRRREQRPRPLDLPRQQRPAQPGAPMLRVDLTEQVGPLLAVPRDLEPHPARPDEATAHVDGTGVERGLEVAGGEVLLQLGAREPRREPVVFLAPVDHRADVVDLLRPRRSQLEVVHPVTLGLSEIRGEGESARAGCRRSRPTGSARPRRPAPVRSTGRGGPRASAGSPAGPGRPRCSSAARTRTPGAD